MDDAPRRFAWPALLPLAFTLFGLWTLVRTGDAMLGIFALVGLVNAVCAWWVWHDAPKRGLAQVPWSLVAAITEPLGIIAYLVVRELKKPSAPA